MNAIDIIYLVILLVFVLWQLFIIEKLQKIKKTIREDLTEIQKTTNVFYKVLDEMYEKINSKSES